MNKLVKGPDIRIGDLGSPFQLADSGGTNWGPLEFHIAGKSALVIFETASTDLTAPALAKILSHTGPIVGEPITIFHIQPGAMEKGPRPENLGNSYHRLGNPNGDTYRVYGLSRDHFMRSSDVALVTIVLDPNCRIAGIFASAPAEDQPLR